ncbi:Ribonuclease [Trema orientale]|uniref:poly(A)-specific ribonuclease n=1 Tax=Trema orientale TaxID=63057 RepID=A0A2P5F3E3_TREOI|nr:Ribonuclease [Trema orientale]
MRKEIFPLVGLISTVFGNSISASSKRASEKGVKASRFGELFTSSGVVMNDEVHCITFHGGMDLGYLLKILTGKCLPDTRAGFSELLQIYFPNLYDMKHLMRFGNGLYGGLKKLAETLGVQRIGTSHQAGSDSLLTSCTFMKLKGVLAIPIEKQAGVVFGLGEEG